MLLIVKWILLNTTVYITVDTTVDSLSLNHSFKDTTITTDTRVSTAPLEPLQGGDPWGESDCNINNHNQTREGFGFIQLINEI